MSHKYVGFYGEYFVKGDSLQEVWEELSMDYDATFNECRFFELGKELEVEVKEVEKEVVSFTKGKLPK